MGVPMKMQYTVDLNAPLKMQEAGTLMVEGDNLANTIKLEVMDGESPAVLDGCSATAYMIRADGNKPFVACAIEGNIIQAALTASFYDIPGRYHLFVRLTNTQDNTRRTMLWLNGWVNTEGSGSLVDDSGVIPTLEELLEQVEKIEDAVARAETVANMTVESETLPAGSKATASYANGVLSLGLPTGTQGPKGPAGKSAYDFAKDGGYTGPEAEFAAKLAVPFITPEMYGAKGDGVTDDSEAIQAAINAAGNTNIVYLANKTYKISTGLIIGNGTRYVNVTCDGTIDYDGSDAAVKIKNTTLSNVYIHIIRAENGNAIMLDASDGKVQACNITVDFIRSSKIGLYLYTNANTIYYNKIRINDIISSVVGISVYRDDNAATDSYINENWYNIGKISGECEYGIKLINTGANRFFSGDLEGIADTGCSIYIKNGEGNTFRDFRCEENYGQYRVWFSGKCSRNDIELSKIFLQEINVTELGSGSECNVLRSALITANGYNAGTEVHVSYKHGIVYNPIAANVSINATQFGDYVIKQNGALIPTTIEFNASALNGVTFTLGGLYSEYPSIARGFPVVLLFRSANVGKILLKDSRGGTVLDNTDGAYANKSVSVRWNGYDKFTESNIWAVQVLGEVAPTTENWTFVLDDGSTVTKAVLLG